MYLSTALSYFESQGVVHKNIKPANILFAGTRGAVPHRLCPDAKPS